MTVLSLKDIVTASTGVIVAFVGGLALYLQRRDKQPHVKLRAYASLATLRDLRVANEAKQLYVIPGYRLIAMNMGEKDTVLEDILFKPLIIRARYLSPATPLPAPADSRAERESIMPTELLFYRSSRMALALGRFVARDLQDRRYHSPLRLMVWRHLDEYTEGYRRTGFVVRVRAMLAPRALQAGRVRAIERSKREDFVNEEPNDSRG